MKNSGGNDFYAASLNGKRDGGEGMKWAKKSGIKLTVYSLQNAVCCSLAIFHDGLSREENREREGSFSRGVFNNGTLYPAPTAQPTSIHHHSY